MLRWYRGRVQLLRAISGDEDVGTLQLWWDVAVSWMGAMMDYTRAVCHITTEFVRSNGSWFGPVAMANRKRRRTAQRNRCNSLPELEGCVAEPSFGSDYGALDLLDENSSLYELKEMKTQRISSTEQQRGGWEWGPVSTELEPAFLNESDYPAGWLVYHPILRVVTKGEAEEYDQVQAEKQQQQQQQQQQQELPDETKHTPLNDGDHEHAEEKKEDLIGGETKSAESNTKRSPTRQQQPQLDEQASSGVVSVLQPVVAT
jgi:hypothetical protein